MVHSFFLETTCLRSQWSGQVCHICSKHLIPEHVRPIKILRWLRGFRVKIAHFLRLPHNSQKRLEYKANQTKYRKMTRTPRSRVGILIHVFFTEHSNSFPVVNISYYRWSSGGQYNEMTQLSLFTISSQAPLVNILLRFWLEIWHMGEKFLKLCQEPISYALRYAGNMN